MKLNFKRGAALLLAVLLLALAGCGNRGDDEEESVPTGEGQSSTSTVGGADSPAGQLVRGDYEYRAEYLSLPEELDYLGSFTVSGDRIFFGATDYETGVSTLYSMDMEGGDLRQTALGDADGGYISGLDWDGDTGVWLCLEQYSYNYDHYDESTGEGLELESYTAELLHLDAEGNTLAGADIAQDIEEAGIYTLAVDGGGNICLLINTSDMEQEQMEVLVYSPDLELRFRAEYNDWAYYFAVIGGQVYLYSWSAGLVPVDVEAGGLGSPMTLDSYGQVYSARNGLLYYSEDNGLMSRGSDETEGYQELTWVDVDINSGNVSGLLVLEDGSILCAVYDNQAMRTELVLLRQVEPGTAGEKTELTLATLYTDQALEAAVIKFNQESDEYRIKLNAYSQYNTDDDWTAGQQKLFTEILAGDVPDLMDLSVLDSRMLVSRGILTDLYPLMDADDTLTREAVVPSLLQAMEVDGGLYELAKTFNLHTIIGGADDVGGEMGWSVEEFMAYVEGLPDGVSALSPTTDRDSFLNEMVQFNLDKFVDWETGHCDFNVEEFISILEFCGTLKTYDDFTDADFDVQPPERIMAGTQRLAELYLMDIQELQLYYAMYEGDITFIGYPSEDTNGSAFSLGTSLGISSTTDHPEAAWEFIKLYMEMEDYTYGLPALQDRLEAYYAELMEEDEEDGVHTWGWGDLTVEIRPATQEEIDTVSGLIENTRVLRRYDQSIWEIVEEEVQSFYAGEKTAEAVAGLITNRVQTYVSEQL